MLIYKDILTGKDVCSDSYPGKVIKKKGLLVCETKEIVEGEVTVDTGANASAEAEEEEAGGEVKERYNNLVRAHQLNKIDLTKKEFKGYIKMWFKNVAKKFGQLRGDALELEGEFGTDYTEDDIKAEYDEWVAGEYDTEEYDGWTKKLKFFMSNAKALNTWITKNVIKNFDNVDIYCPEGEYGQDCLLIPAIWPADGSGQPHFYIFTRGCTSEKN